MDQIQSALQELEALHKRYKILHTIHIGVYAVVFLLLVFGFQVGVVLGLVNVAVYFLVIRPTAKKYSETLGRYAVSCGLWQRLEEAHWTDPLSLQELTDLELLPSPNGKPLSRRRWQGKQGAGHFTCGELTYNYIPPHEPRKNAQFLSGTLLTFDLTWKPEGELLLLKRDLVPAEVKQAMTAEKGYVSQPLPAESWADGYELWLRGIPPEGLTQLLRSALREGAGVSALRIAPSGMSVFLHNRFFSHGTISPRIAPTRQQLQVDLLPELKPLLTLRDALDQL